jgi:hypothetical protein
MTHSLHSFDTNWDFWLNYQYTLGFFESIARILKAHSHSKSGGSIWASLECQCCFWIAEGLVLYLTMWLLTLQLFKNSIDTQEKLQSITRMKIESPDEMTDIGNQSRAVNYALYSNCSGVNHWLSLPLLSSIWFNYWIRASYCFVLNLVESLSFDQSGNEHRLLAVLLMEDFGVRVKGCTICDLYTYP